MVTYSRYGAGTLLFNFRDRDKYFIFKIISLGDFLILKNL